MTGAGAFAGPQPSLQRSSTWGATASCSRISAPRQLVVQRASPFPKRPSDGDSELSREVSVESPPTLHEVQATDTIGASLTRETRYRGRMARARESFLIYATHVTKLQIWRMSRSRIAFASQRKEFACVVRVSTGSPLIPRFFFCQCFLACLQVALVRFESCQPCTPPSVPSLPPARPPMLPARIEMAITMPITPRAPAIRHLFSRALGRRSLRRLGRHDRAYGRRIPPLLHGRRAVRLLLRRSRPFAACQAPALHSHLG